MFQSKKPKSSCGVRHAGKFRLRSDASHSTRCSRAFNTQLPRVIAERAIHYGLVMGLAEVWPKPMKFLVDMLNHAH